MSAAPKLPETLPEQREPGGEPIGLGALDDVRTRTVHLDDGEGNWLVSYADMMTLLLGFFVMLQAFSKFDTERLEQLKKTTAKELGVEYQMPYEELAAKLRQVLRDFNLDKEVELSQTDAGLSIISQGTLFFDSASPELKPRAWELVDKVGGILSESAKAYAIQVEGHSDDVPIVSSQFPSNWELSSARASTVVRLFESKGLPHASLRPVGFADTVPVAPNRDPAGKPLEENRAKNRRIVIRVQKQLAEGKSRQQKVVPLESPDQLRSSP